MNRYRSGFGLGPIEASPAAPEGETFSAVVGDVVSAQQSLKQRAGEALAAGEKRAMRAELEAELQALQEVPEGEQNDETALERAVERAEEAESRLLALSGEVSAFSECVCMRSSFCASP